VTFSLPQRTPNSYNSLSFCTRYIIADMVPVYGTNISCIKAIKSTYSACKGSKTTRKKGLNEYLKAEKDAGIYEAAQESERGAKTAKERFAKKSRQALTKRAQPSSSGGGSCRKKAQRGFGAEAHGIFRPEAGLETIFSADDEFEEEEKLASATSLRHQNQHNKGPAASVGT